MYHEAFQVLLKGIDTDELNFEGKFYRFSKVPMLLHPVQRPHPPLWYGVNIPENADWPAQNDINVISLALPQAVRPIFDRYRSVRSNLGKPDSTLYGVGRHVVVAETDAKALDIARRAYPKWRASFFWLFKRNSSAPRIAAIYPETFDELQGLGIAVAGSPETVRNFVRTDIETTGANYFAPWLAFGDMALPEILQSVELFAREVMPALR
jgi:alkanesulfonate monooxygenase SsuD/methylene tetrahydromethanopterin reductase-like flavin-dependent oxidoreductase (luciferase family)